MSEEHAALVEIVTTVSGDEEAERLARTLVEERLAACVSRDPVRSLYRWQGELRDDPEVRLVIKTTAGRATRVRERLAELHPYDTPAVVTLPVLHANDDYAAWLRDAVGHGEEA
ncbi:MAG TPA: divalent-cation tolerance protein CutA [bacterium]|nr:divalent-cation tolerance protein CutA [bacterium]